MALKSKSDDDDVDLQEELEDFFENIKEDGVFQVSALPELIKKQSLWMHLCMQYYVHSVSDTFSHALVYQPSSALGIVTTQRYESLQENLQSIYSAEQTMIDTIKKQYAANGAFHTTAYIHILKRIEAFTVPFFPTHTSDVTFDLTIFLKTCLGVFLQDCLPRHVQITATNKEIKHFQGHFQPFLDIIFAEKNDSILITYYASLSDSDILSTHLSDTMIYRFTNHIYTLEAMLWYEISNIFQQIPELACLRYSTFQVIPLSIMKQTILGVCILYNFLQHHFPKCEHTAQMMEIYHELIVREIRCMPFVAMRSVSDIYITMTKKYTSLLDPLTTDERTMFHCQCIMESLHEVMTKKKDTNDTSITIGHEDIVWLKHCLVTIQGYARKFYIPTH